MTTAMNVESVMRIMFMQKYAPVNHNSIISLSYVPAERQPYYRYYLPT